MAVAKKRMVNHEIEAEEDVIDKVEFTPVCVEASDEESSEDADPDDKGIEKFLIAAKKRERGCLEGCICTKPTGRACGCKTKGCGEACSCDKSLCRHVRKIVELS